MSEIPEHGFEPVPGLPENLPEGEAILWQGQPDTREFAVTALHLRKVAIYFVALLGYKAWVETRAGESLSGALVAVSGTASLALAALALIVLFAWLVRRTTLYTITNRRVVMRFGIALPMSVNLPFTKIGSADMRRSTNGSGDLALRPSGPGGLGYVVLWPHVRRWTFRRPWPTLRAIGDVDAVAELLGNALRSSFRPEAEPLRSPRAAGATAPHRHEDLVRRGAWPLAAAASLVVLTVVSVGIVSLTRPDTAPPAVADVVDSIRLAFADAEDGSVVVLDAQTRETLDVLPAGTNNFLRATLRGLVRGRSAHGDTGEDAFVLYRTASGRIVLEDPVTRRQVDLWAFGETNARAFARFLDLRRDGIRLSQSLSATVSAVSAPGRDGDNSQEARP